MPFKCMFIPIVDIYVMFFSYFQTTIVKVTNFAITETPS